MGTSAYRYVRKSPLYKGVSEVVDVTGKIRFVFDIQIKGAKTRGYRDTERAAALAYDMVLINNNMEPRNILKKK